MRPVKQGLLHRPPRAEIGHAEGMFERQGVEKRAAVAGASAVLAAMI